MDILLDLNFILLSMNPSFYLLKMKENGSLKQIIPELESLDDNSIEGLPHKNIFKHTMGVLNNIKSQYLPLRLAALFHDIGKLVTRSVTNGEVHFYEHEIISEQMAHVIMLRIGYESKVIDEVLFLVRNHMRPHTYLSTWTDAAVRRFRKDIGNNYLSIMELAKADITSSNPNKIKACLDRMKELEERVVALEKAEREVIKPLLDGKFLMEKYGRSGGAWIKEVHDLLIGEQRKNPALDKAQAEIVVDKFMDIY